MGVPMRRLEESGMALRAREQTPNHALSDIIINIIIIIIIRTAFYTKLCTFCGSVFVFFFLVRFFAPLPSSFLYFFVGCVLAARG